MCPARWLSDQNFGMCIPPHDFLYPFYDTNSNYYRRWRCFNNSQDISKEFGSTIENEKGNYKITLDVKHFRPDEISVKVTDTEIIVEGKHEERQDSHGFISRQFKRRYPLPNQCLAENVTSTMSSDGVLIIIAEKKSSTGKEKIVPIKMCGLSAKKAQIIEGKITSEITQNSVKENIKDTEDMTCRKERAQNILLKEEHSRLLKPELLKEVGLSGNEEKMLNKQVMDIKSLSEKRDNTNVGATSNQIEESLTKSSLGLSELTAQLAQNNLPSTSDTYAMKTMSNMSKTLIEESSSSYKSSSSMTSTLKSSGKVGEYVSDIITAELKEAAENI